MRLKAQGGSCNAAIPVSMRFDQSTNPTGVRCDVYDHMVNIFGRDPVTGYARRPLDNVGVQYGLAALNSGAISKQQFLDLNQNIGGYDNNGNFIAGRAVGDVKPSRSPTDSGRVTYGNQGMRATPIIDYRGYVDQPENSQEVHSTLPFLFDARAAGEGEWQFRQPGDARRRWCLGGNDGSFRRYQPGLEPCGHADGPVAHEIVC